MFCTIYLFTSIIIVIVTVICRASMRRRTTTTVWESSEPLTSLDLTNSGDNSVLALGRTAILGELYDASSETFVGRTIFRSRPSTSVFSTQDIRGISTETKIVKGLKDTSEFLGVDAKVTIGVFAGLLEVEGAASYLKKGKSSKNSQSALMSYKIRTVRENLQTSVYELRQFLSYRALNTAEAYASHIVVGIEYGADILIVASSTKTTGESQEDISGKLAVYFRKLEKLGTRISASADVKYHAEDENDEFESSLQVFGDISSSILGPVQNFSQVLNFLSNVPALIEKTNGGRGRAIKYILFPIQDFKRFLQPHFPPFTGISSPSPSSPSISEVVLEEFLLLFDEIAAVLEELEELRGKMRDHSICLTEEETTEVLELSFQFDKNIQNFKNKFKSGLNLVKTGKWRDSGGNSRHDDANSYLNRIRTEWLAGTTSTSREGHEKGEINLTSILTLEKVKEKIMTGFSSALGKIQLYEKFKAAGISYVGAGGTKWRVNEDGFSSAQEFLCKYPEFVTFVLFFSRSSIQSSGQKWLDTISLFLNQLNKGDNKLVAVDCDLCPADLEHFLPASSSSYLPIIHEYFNGMLVSSDVLFDFESLPQGQGSGQIKVPASIYPDVFLTLGALYNVQTGKFLDNQNLFGKEKVSPKFIQTSSSSRIIQSGNVLLNSPSKFKDVFKALQISPSIALKILLGNHQSGSSGGQIEAFLDSFAQVQKSPNRILGAVIHTRPSSISVESLNFEQVVKQTNDSNKETGPIIDKKSLFIRHATHFIREIHFGDRWILHLSIMDDNRGIESESKEFLETNKSGAKNMKNNDHFLAAILQKIGHIVSPETSSPIDLNLLSGDQVLQSLSPVSLELFRLSDDVSRDSFYIHGKNFSDFETSLKQSLNKVIFSEIKENCKAPLVYILEPIENLQRSLGLCLGRPPLRPILDKRPRKDHLWSLVNLFDKLAAGQRELEKMKEKLEGHAEAVTDDDWREFESIQQDFSSRADKWKNQIQIRIPNSSLAFSEFHLKEFLLLRLDRDQVREETNKKFRRLFQKMEIFCEIRRRQWKWKEKLYYIGRQQFSSSSKGLSTNQPSQLGTFNYVLGIKNEFLQCSPSKLSSERSSFWKNLEYFFELSALTRAWNDNNKQNGRNTPRSSAQFLLVDGDARNSLPFFLLSSSSSSQCPSVIVEYKFGKEICGDVWSRDKEQEAAELNTSNEGRHKNLLVQGVLEEVKEERTEQTEDFLGQLRTELEEFSQDLKMTQTQLESQLETHFPSDEE